MRPVQRNSADVKPAWGTQNTGFKAATGKTIYYYAAVAKANRLTVEMAVCMKLV